MAPVRERHNYYFVGENVDDEFFCHELDRPVSQLHAELIAKRMLREMDGGHIDVFDSDTDEFVFDVEV